MRNIFNCASVCVCALEMEFKKNRVYSSSTFILRVLYQFVSSWFLNDIRAFIFLKRRVEGVVNVMHIEYFYDATTQVNFVTLVTHKIIY